MLSLNDGVILTETEHGAVLLEERTGRYWMTNDTGLLVLRCLLDGQTISEAATHLCARYTGVEQSRADIDVQAIVDRLLATGMVRT
jgi:hypothetical protein